MRPKVGDMVLVLGPAHFEKSEIIDRKKGVFTLKNGILMDRDFYPKNSKMKIKPFNQEEYDFLVAKQQIPRFLDLIKARIQSLDQEKAIKLHKKLSKMVN